MSTKITRRQILKATLGLAGLSYLSPLEAFSMEHSKRFKIGACDWSINQLARVDSIEVAKKIGLDGVQISLGTIDDNMHLREAKVQQQYKDACDKYGMSIGGMAIGELNNIPYKSDPKAEQWVCDSIDVARMMDVKVVLLAFFSKGDLKNDIEGTKETVKRLKNVMSKAEDNGIILGIESWLSAEEHMEILNAVNSPNLKVYYDVANSNKMGYNIYEEIRTLGKENICEFHAKENDHLLGKGVVNFKKIRKAIDDIAYDGWIQIEAAVPKDADMLESYIWNNKYLRSVMDA